MTTQTQQPLHFPVIDRNRGWKDLFVVSFLVVVLGAFVAQIASPPPVADRVEPVAAAASAPTARG
jgi:hypothetical protein